MQYRELANFVPDGPDFSGVPDDLMEAVETFTCRFCGSEFQADGDLYRHYDCYGCGCIPEFILDTARDAFGLKMTDVQNWNVERREPIQHIETKGRTYYGTEYDLKEPRTRYEYRVAVTINGKTRIVPDTWNGIEPTNGTIHRA